MFITALSATAAEVFTYIGYVIVAILALMLMIIIHESGHYLAGKLLGFKIDEFSIGFGPAIFKHRNKKTGELFVIRPIPLGGYCAFHGEDEESENDKKADDTEENEVFDDASLGLKPEKKYGILAPETQTPSGKRGILAYTLKKPTGEYFNDQPAWKRLIVLFSGAFFNFLSAIFIITIYFSAYGQILPIVVDTYDFVAEDSSQCFETGDVILAVNGKQVNIMLQEDVNAVFGSVGDSAEFKVLRDRKAVTFTAHKADYTYVGEEKQEDGSVITKTEQKHGFGVSYSITRQKLDFFRAFGRSFSFCFFIVFKILASLGALITGKIGIASAGGTITVVKTIAEVSAYGFDSFLYVVAIISANLAVMNLLPIPALDGSRMLFTLIEMIFRKPVPRKIEGIIHTVGLIVLVLLVVFLDIFHLVSG